MKKLIVIVILLAVIWLAFYYQIYKTGKFNNFLQQHSDSQYAQAVEYMLGNIFLMLGRFDSALFRFKRVLEIYKVDKFKPVSCYKIAECYEENKDIKTALKFYRITFENYPNTYYGELAKKRYDYLLLIGYKE